MERYKSILSYAGGAFSGSQRQSRRRTVQAEFEKALKGLGWHGRSILLAARTDAGVHAAGQVAGFDLDWSHGVDALRDALNARLPADLAVLAIELVPVEFHPRYDARTRCYRYRTYFQPVRDPLRESFAWRIWPPVQVGELLEIAGVFLGQHDFGAFGSAPRPEGSTVRTVTLSKWRQFGDECHFEVEADAFLYRMVRRLVWVQLAVAHGACSREVVARALRSARSRTDLPAGLAPAHGLTLMQVTY